MNEQSISISHYIPPTLRFLVELTTWVWLLWATFSVNWWYILLFITSIGGLAAFNFPGDKNQEGPVEVSGMGRIAIEVYSGLLGVIAALVLFGLIGAILQGMLTFISYLADAQRWSWFLGIRNDPPQSVTMTHKKKD